MGKSKGIFSYNDIYSQRLAPLNIHFVKQTPYNGN